MVEVIWPPSRVRPTYASSIRTHGFHGRRRVPAYVSLVSSPRRVEGAAAERAERGGGLSSLSEVNGLTAEASCAAAPCSAREQRRLEMERELCEKLGLQSPEVTELSPSPPKRQARPTSAGAPKRPPKPKPHRPLPSEAELRLPLSVEELPSVKRWRSGLMASLWPEERPELSQTAPSGMLVALDGEDGPEASPASASPASGADRPEPSVEAEEPPAEAAEELEAEVPSARQAPPQGSSRDVCEAGRTTGAKLLEEGSRRLRENLLKLRLENRRHRVRPDPPCKPTASEDVEAPKGPWAEEANSEKLRRFEELRRKIAMAEEQSWAEEQRLRMEQKEAEERREKQEAFERSLQEHRAREAKDAEEQAAKEDEARQQWEERQSRRRMQLAQEEQRSRQLEEQRLAREREHSPGAGAAAERLRWEHEAEERRRVEDYARFRRRRFEEWERHFAAERLRFASEAEFCAATLRQKARMAAQADERFYASQREPPHEESGRPTRVEGGEALPFSVEERQLLQELRSVLGAPKEAQKAKVKDLLIRWHPDKNPQCADKAKQLFQFLQEQRRAVLGL
ncbi:unnamed protein product [Durusdinium trenchii]|uniref:J domain-containing protein n=1 Tax=Durusdinium trenchii TaxID=1381693 RepID=A0ABP0P5N2_9DINO